MPVRDADGDVYGQLAVFRDITQEKELEQLREDYTRHFSYTTCVHRSRRS
jgi:hypothetical protein